MSAALAHAQLETTDSRDLRRFLLRLRFAHSNVALRLIIVPRRGHRTLPGDAVIGLETRPDFINRIANSDGVREYIRPDGRQMDWTPLAERSPAITRVVVLSNGEDALAAFELTAPGIYQSHTLFGPTCRGRRAIDTAIEMVRWMFAHGASVVWGSTPRSNRKACLFNRWIGAVELPTSDETDMIFEIRRDRWAH